MLVPLPWIVPSISMSTKSPALTATEPAELQVAGDPVALSVQAIAEASAPLTRKVSTFDSSTVSLCT